MKKKVNFYVRLKDVSGQDYPGERDYLSNIIADCLVVQEARENILQTYELAQRINSSTGEIEITQSEKDIIRKMCEGGKLYILSAAQILNIINK